MKEFIPFFKVLITEVRVDLGCSVASLYVRSVFAWGIWQIVAVDQNDFQSVTVNAPPSHIE